MRTMMSDDFAARCTRLRVHLEHPAMAEGLRVLGCCPKCKGELEFGTRGVTAPEPAVDQRRGRRRRAALVLGIPRI